MVQYHVLYEINVGALSVCTLDIEGDGKGDLIILTPHHVACFDGHSGQQLWVVPVAGKGITASVDRIYVFADYEITVLDRAGNVEEKHIVGKKIRRGFSADMDKDGIPEAVFVADGTIYILKGSKLTAKRDMFSEDALFYDWDGDDIEELAVLMQKGLRVYDFKWKEIGKEKIKEGARLFSLDIDGDGENELLVIAKGEMIVYSGKEKIESIDLAVIPEYIVRFDLDQDGIPEILLGDGKAVYVIRENTLIKTPQEVTFMTTDDLNGDGMEELIVLQNGLIKIIGEVHRVVVEELKYPPVGFIGETTYITLKLKNTDLAYPQQFSVIMSSGNEISGMLAPGEETTLMIPIFIDAQGVYSFTWTIRDSHGDVQLPPFYISALSKDEIVSSLKKLAQLRRVPLEKLRKTFTWLSKEKLEKIIEIGLEAGIYMAISGNMVLFNEDALMEITNELEKKIGRVLASGWRVPLSSVVEVAGIDQQKLTNIISDIKEIYLDGDSIVVPQNANIRKIARHIAREIVRIKTEKQ